jgi:purine-nucleoside phosphorylase
MGTSTRDVSYINKINSPEYGIILGSGLGSHWGGHKIEFTLPYNEILIFLYLQFRDIGFVFGTIGDKIVVGRFHFYEGYSMKEVTPKVEIF